MRIISKYHDYYDTAMGQGIDPSLVYKRDFEVVEVCEVQWRPPSVLIRLWNECPWLNGWYEHGLLFLVFCGRAYPYWCYGPITEPASFFTVARLVERAKELYAKRASFKSDRFQGVLTGESVFWRLENVKSFLDLGSTPGWMKPGVTYKRLNEYVDRVSGTPIDHDGHHRFDTPSFLVAPKHCAAGLEHFTIVRNPVLKDLDFQKVMDPFTAFQEIAMFLGGVMAAEDKAPIRVGSDEVVARQKGFDEWSFRTQAPGQKKLNRKANKQRKRGGTAES